MRHAMQSFAALALLLAAGLVVAGGPGIRTLRDGGSAPASLGTPQDRIVELRGTVQSVDRRVGTLRVTPGAAGARDTVLQVTDATRVRVGDREGSVADVRAGARIRASYQDRFGIKVAQLIEVTSGVEPS